MATSSLLNTHKHRKTQHFPKAVWLSDSRVKAGDVGSPRHEDGRRIHEAGGSHGGDDAGLIDGDWGGVCLCSRRPVNYYVV